MRTNLDYRGVDYDYERSGCVCNAYERGDYCRCTTIEKAWVTKIDVNEVIDRLFHDRSKNQIDKYCFDRICRINYIYDKDYYEIKVCGGYYGEEIDGVFFENEEKIEELYSKINGMNSDIEKMQFVLDTEYGYMIDFVAKSTNVSIVECLPSDIIVPQKEYYHRLEVKVVDSYKDYNLPCAVCVMSNGKYKIIDGYHRIAANKNNNHIDIIVLE